MDLLQMENFLFSRICSGRFRRRPFVHGATSNAFKRSFGGLLLCALNSMNGSQRTSYVECRTYNFCGTNPRRSPFSPNRNFESIVYVLAARIALPSGIKIDAACVASNIYSLRSFALDIQCLLWYRMHPCTACTDYSKRYAIHFTIFIIINLYHAFAMALLAARAKLMKLPHKCHRRSLIHAVILRCSRIIIIQQ